MQIQNRSCRIYGDTGAEYLLLQMANEHDFAGMAREVEAIHPHNHFCWPLSKSKTGTMICRLGLRRLCGASRASAAGQRTRLHGWNRLCRASADSIL